MPSVDIHNSMDAVNALNIQAITTDTTTVGNIIDTDGAEGIEFILHSAGVSAGDFTPKIEDGDDAALSDAADVDSSLIIGSLAGAQIAAANAVTKFGIVNHKRYVRVSIVSDNSANGTLGVSAIKMPLNQKNIS